MIPGVHECRYKSGTSSQVRSGLGTVKRDWSANKPQNTELDDPDSDVISGWSPSPPSTAASRSSKSRLDGLQASLNSSIASSEELLSSSQSSQKRAAEPSNLRYQPPAKKRALPASFFGGPPMKTKPLSRAASLSSRSFGAPVNTKQKPSPLITRGPSQSTLKTSSKLLGPISLSQEQNYILKLAQEGKSLFYTGSAGTGKSVLLREIIKTLRKKFVTVPDAVAVTASTGKFDMSLSRMRIQRQPSLGIAACNIGGMTIHSFAGIGLGREKAEQLADRVRKNKKASSRWMRTKVLVIDEGLLRWHFSCSVFLDAISVSMVDGDLFEKLSKVGSIIRKHNDPFGGIQVSQLFCRNDDSANCVLAHRHRRLSPVTSDRGRWPSCKVCL